MEINNKKIITSTSFIVLIFLFLSVIPIRKVLFKDGIISNIDFCFIVHPEWHIKTKSFYALEEYNTGIRNPARKVMVYGEVFNYILEKAGFSTVAINKLWFIIPTCLTGLIGYWFFRVFFNEIKEKIFAVICGIFLMFSSSNLMAYFFGWTVWMTLPFLASICMVLFYIRGMRDNFNYKQVIFSVISSFFSMILIQVFLLAGVMIFFYTLFNIKQCFKHKSRSIKYVFTFLSLLFLINSWFFLLYYNSSILKDTYITLNLEDHIISVGKENGILKALTLKSVDYAGHIRKYNYSTTSWVINIIIVIASFSPLLFVNLKDKKILLWLYCCALIMLFFTSAYSGMFKEVYMFCFKNIPLFPIFRNHTKGYYFISLIYSVGIAYFLFNFINKIKIRLNIDRFRHIIILNCFLIIISVISFFASYPLCTGNMGAEDNKKFSLYSLSTFNIPEYYDEMRAYLLNKELNVNLLLLPFPRWSNFFTWYPLQMVGNITHIYFPQPIIGSDFELLPEDNFLINLLWHRLKNGISDNAYLMKMLNIKYIVYQNDQIDLLRERDKFNLMKKNVKESLTRDKNIVFERKIGKLELYSIRNL